MLLFLKEELTMKTEIQMKTGAKYVHKGRVPPLTQEAVPMAENTEVKLQRQRNAAAQQLLHEWLANESGYDEETWPMLKQALEENRASSNRRLFRD